MRKKRVIMIVLLVLLCCVYSSVFAVEIEDSGPWKFTSYGYSPRVLNVYTDYTPYSGAKVTLYSWSGSTNQQWRIFPLYGYVNGAPIGTYRIVPQSNLDLVLNYNQATTKCTVYDWATNNLSDYPVSFANASGDVVIILAFYGSRYLGNSGNYNGAQCYWYYYGPNSYIHDEDVWIMTNLYT